MPDSKLSFNHKIIDFINWFQEKYFSFIPQLTFRYAACGGTNTVFDICLYFICYNFILNKTTVEFGFIAISPHIAAFILVFPISFSTGFLLAKYITFSNSVLKGRIQLFRYALSVSGSIFLNYILIKLFVEYFNIFPTPSKILTTIIVIVYSYFVQKTFSFKSE